MRPSLRFLTLAIVGWAGVRAATLGLLPGVSILAIPKSEAKAPPVAGTPIAAAQFPELSQLEPPTAPAAVYAYPPPEAYGYPPGTGSFIPAVAQAYGRPIMVPIYYRYQAVNAPPLQPASYTPILPPPAPLFYPPNPQLDDWPLSRVTAAMPARSQITVPMQSAAPSFTQNRLDRVQLTMWAMLRSQQDVIAPPSSLANSGTLGGSQAGARLMYNVSPQLAAVLRTSSDVGRRGGEIALGARLRPLRSIPVWITAERRQALGRYGGGRNAFALFAEGGVYGQPMPLGFTLDGYAQGGIVGLHSRDLFIDGAAAFTRPVYRQFAAGFGVWGGVQPGLYRIDAGPRVTMQVRPNVRVHLDWRQRLGGNARPGSGPVLTLAGDF